MAKHKKKIRLEKLDKRTAELMEKGYKRKDQIISGAYTNVVGSLLPLPIVILFCVLFYLKNGSFLFLFSLNYSYFIFIIILVVTHELLHGFTWAMFTESKFKSIEFGFKIKSLCPYCTCGEQLIKWQYILGVIMPCLVIGVIPAVIAVVCNSIYWFWVALLMIVASGGDLIVTIKVLAYKTNSRNVIFMDHPTDIGFIVFEQ